MEDFWGKDNSIIITQANTEGDLKCMRALWGDQYWVELERGGVLMGHLYRQSHHPFHLVRKIPGVEGSLYVEKLA